MKRIVKTFAAAALCLTALMPAQAMADALSVASFGRETGIRVGGSEIQRTWQALQAMGTTQFLGGQIGGLRLDEASMIAGAMTVGASEFDALLNGFGLNVSAAGVGSLLSERMNAASGINLSTLTGSFTGGIGPGGSVSPTSLASSGGASAAGGGACSATVAQGMAQTGKAHVDKIVTAATSDEFGFSQLGQVQSGAGGGTGFSALGCLDRLFQNAGSDILFKPPSLGSLTSQLQNWTCGEAASVQEQLAGAFGDGSRFMTTELGGFFPRLTYGEANEQNPAGAGTGQAAERTFGAAFATFRNMTETEMAKATNVLGLFR